MSTGLKATYTVILAACCGLAWGCVSTDLVQTMLTDINRLQQENVVLRREIDLLRGEVESLKTDPMGPDERDHPVVPDTSQDPDLPRVPVDPDRAEPDPEPVDTLSRPSQVSGEEMYADAQALYMQSRYREAYQAFSQATFLDPDDEFQARCFYWMGECMYAQAAYQRALDHFGRVFAHYSTSSKVPDALLKIGFTYYEMKNYNGARQALNEFLRRFPDHRAVPLARERLDRMNYAESGGVDEQGY